MNEITAYLNTHYEIREVAFVAEGAESYHSLRGFLKDFYIDSICIVSSFADCTKESIQRNLEVDRYYDRYHVPQEITFCDIENFQGMKGQWALCFRENVDVRNILKMSRFSPAHLLAEIREDTVSAFKIWEEYKSLTPNILIKTHRTGKDTQVLDWHREEENNIELSVIFPMYNVAKYLDQCIESVTEWKAPYVEFLFVNDGSPDNSREVVLEWSKRDSRVKLLDKENGGCASAREFGMSHAKGRYIGFIDPDDWIDPQMFKKLLRSALIGSYDIAYCGYNEYYETTKETRQVEDAIAYPYCDGCTDHLRILDLINYRRVAIWRGIYKRQMLEDNNVHFYTDLRRFDDLPFSVETTAVAKSVVAVPEYMYYYRLSRPGQDVSADDERLYVHFDIFKYLNKSIAGKKEAYLTDVLQICKISTHLWAISKIKPEYLDCYVQQAAEDLNSTGDFKRTYKLAKERIGRDKAELYKAIINGDMEKLAAYKE